MFNLFQFITLPILTPITVYQVHEDLRVDYSTQTSVSIPVDIPLVPLDYWDENLLMTPDPYLPDHILKEVEQIMPSVEADWNRY